MYVFEGQQLEKLYDLIEEYKSALTSNFEYENTDLHTEKVSTCDGHNAYSNNFLQLFIGKQKR